MAKDEDNDKLIEIVSRILCKKNHRNPDDNMGSLNTPRWSNYAYEAIQLIKQINDSGFTFEEVNNATGPIPNTST